MVSCKRESPTQWQSDWHAPLLKGQLDLSNLIIDGVLEVQPDSSLVLVMDQEVLNFTVGEVVQIPDTSVVSKFTIPPPLQNLTAQPGMEFIDEPQNFKYNGIAGALVRLDVKSGEIFYRLESPIQENTTVTYSIPGATKYGMPLVLILPVPAAPANGVSVVEGTFDLSDYVFDLKGISGNEVNTLESDMIVQLNADANATTITNQDTVKLTTTFREIIPAYAKGYFGNQVIEEDTSGLDFTLLESLVDASIDLDQVDAHLYLENGIGADGRVRINRLTAVNTQEQTFLNLQHPVMGTSININRATDPGGVLTPSLFETRLHLMNSNIDEFLELVPNRVGYDMEIVINPLGNVSNGTDFLYCESAVRAGLKLEIPLCFGASRLVLRDTLQVNLSGNSSLDVESGTLHLSLENGFPLEFRPEFYLIENGFITDTLATTLISSGTLNAAGRVISPSVHAFDFELTAENVALLKREGQLIWQVVLNTAPYSGQIKIYQDYAIKVNGTIEARVNHIIE